MNPNPAATRRPLTVRVARWSATHPWRAILLWLLFVAVCMTAGQVTGTRKATDLATQVGESHTAAQLLHDSGLTDPARERVLITPRAGQLDAGLADRAAADLAARLRGVSAVAKVDPAETSTNGQALLVTATLDGDPQKAVDRVPPLLEATAATQRAYPGLRVEEIGDGSVAKAINTEVGKEFGKSTVLSLPVTLLILLVAFGAIVAAGVPVLLALSAVFSAVGLSALASHLVPDSGTASNMILLMGMAVGIDYSLFYLKREREERRRGRTHLDAIEIAAETSGHSVVVSGIAVLVAMAGLYLASDAIFASLATGAILVVAVAVLGSLTVLPALLAKLGRRIDRPRVPVLWRLTNRDTPPRLLPVLLRPALRRPGRTLVVSVLALTALALPALGMTLHATTARDFPKSMPAVQTLDRLAVAFPGQQTSHDVVVESAPQDARVVEAALTDLVRSAGHNPLFAVTGADAPTIRSSADGRVHTVTLDVPFAEGSTQAKQSLTELRTRLVPQALDPVPHTREVVGGSVASNVDYVHHVGDKLPLVMGFVLALTFLMMAVTFRSVVVALTTIAINLLSAGAAFGVLVLVFQHGWGAGLLGVHATGPIVSWIPLFLFAVLFGLSMDYHVFVVSRIREAAKRGLAPRAAVADGLTRSAGVVTSAAIVMVSVFAIFASLDMIEFKQLGIGLAAAVLIDAIVVRIVVLPSLMSLLGRANWWPSKLSRRDAGHRLDTGAPQIYARV